MTELDQLWSQMLEQASEKAVDSRQGDLAEYLRLKAANDAIRSRGVKWLFDCFIEVAFSRPGGSDPPDIERLEPHHFLRGNSKIVGSCVRVRKGVRCISLEAGWTRTPGDGFMRGGALAAARIAHFGDKRSETHLVLAYNDKFPLWHTEARDGERTLFETNDLNKHFELLAR
jgi:hypothetical protein